MIDLLIYHLAGKRRARRLATEAYHDLLDLWNFRMVLVSAKGRSLTEIYVNISNRLDRRIKVVLTHGTAFRARGSHQNMVARREEAFLLPAQGTKYLTVSAACINADRPIPGTKDGFHGVKKVSPQVERFLLESDGSSANVVQAGVWAITDGYSRDQIKARLIRTSTTGRTTVGISDSDINLAHGILNRLEIPNHLN